MSRKILVFVLIRLLPIAAAALLLVAGLERSVPELFVALGLLFLAVSGWFVLFASTPAEHNRPIGNLAWGPIFAALVYVGIFAMFSWMSLPNHAVARTATHAGVRMPTTR